MSETVTVTIAEPLMGQVVPDVPLQIHDGALCEGFPCPFHAPSDHHMVDWPMIVRLDKEAIVERTCEHGTGHPDPDSLAYYRRVAQLGMSFTPADAEALGIHGCDGCCRVSE